MKLKIKEPGSAITHFIGWLMAVLAAAPLLIRSAREPDSIHIIAMSVFMLSMILLYAASTIYHTVDSTEKVNRRLRKMDHMMIFILIAGSYTPICLIVLHGRTGTILCTAVWLVAIVGILIKACWITCPKWFSSVIYIAMGWLDRLDIINWIKYLIDNDSKVKIILYGVSMGAATVMNVTGEKLPVNVIAAIEDCGFTRTWEMFSYQLKEMYNLPSRPFLDIANIVTQIRAGYSFGKAEAIEQVKKSTTPTLFIHGDKDRFVPFKMLNQLYQSANCPKEKLVIKGAGHAQCEKIGGQVYWSKIDSFIRKYQD